MEGRLSRMVVTLFVAGIAGHRDRGPPIGQRLGHAFIDGTQCCPLAQQFGIGRIGLGQGVAQGLGAGQIGTGKNEYRCQDNGPAGRCESLG